MLLKDKVAVVYGAGGAIGGAVARGFAREGAVVYLAGRSQDMALNAVGHVHVQGKPLAELSLAEFEAPIAAYARSQFVIAKAVTRPMLERGRGVLLLLSTPAARRGFTGVAGVTLAQMLHPSTSTSVLKRYPRLDEVASAAVFAASDAGGAMTGAIMNLSCGSVFD